MKTFRSKTISLILFCVMVALLTAGLLQANIIEQFSRLSLRYETPIGGETARAARQQSASQGAETETETFWPTFWREEIKEFSVGARTVQADAILFSGDGALVWPANYIAGGAPSSVDGAGIAVSETLAHYLWGSTDIIGMAVNVNNEPRIVRGVFSGDITLALLSFHIEDTTQSWTGVDLSGGPPHSTRNDAENFATVSGLGRPSYVLTGGAITLARFMSVFPLLLFAVYAFILLAGFGANKLNRFYYAKLQTKNYETVLNSRPETDLPVNKKKDYRVAGAVIFFAGLILLAFLLPLLLDTLPPWFIPTRWGDFAFWASLLQQANNSLREFLYVNPALRDVELRIHLLRQTGIFIGTLCCGITVFFRWRYKAAQYPASLSTTLSNSIPAE